MTPGPDDFHRTAKLLVEQRKAKTIEEGHAILASLVLQVAVGRESMSSLTEQAMLLTVINTGRRAFVGGVHVRIADDPELTAGWAAGRRLSEAIADWGGTVVVELMSDRPTVVIGSTDRPAAITVWPTWSGWAGGVVTDAEARLKRGSEFVLSGILAAGMAVSECFQCVVGNPRAGRRAIGLSLWRPDLDWRAVVSAGPHCAYLPVSYWLAGLGHLGQAYAWAIGLLPYTQRKMISVLLQDYDFIVKANESTSLLTHANDLGKRKTRAVSTHLESLGFRTTIVERAFDGQTYRIGEEPLLILSGFDRPEPRRLLGGAGFDRVIDAGLGAGPQYLEILVQSFARGADTTHEFDSQARPVDIRALLTVPGYSDVVRRLMEEGLSRGEAECGLTDVAGVTVGASFVGAVAAAITLAEPLRLLHGGYSCSAISLSLRSPERLEVAFRKGTPAAGFGHAAAAGF